MKLLRTENGKARGTTLTEDLEVDSNRLVKPEGVIELIDLIEKETGMEFDPDILLADNLSTINKIMKLVQNLK